MLKSLPVSQQSGWRQWHNTSWHLTDSVYSKGRVGCSSNWHTEITNDTAQYWYTWGQTVFYAHTDATYPFTVKSCTASSVSEDGNTMDSEAAVADTLVSEDVAVDSDPGTESFQSGCWNAIYFKAHDYWFVGFVISRMTNWWR